MTQHDLEGRVVVVTGATRGIGLGIAKYLASVGANVVGTGRSETRLEATRSELGDGHLILQSDVGDRAHCAAIIEQAVANYGRLDGLVANAQSFRPVTPLVDVTPSDMDVLFHTGPYGTLWLMQAAHPHMAAAGRGRIVTMGTAMGLSGAPGYGPYAASNEAIRSLTRTAAREWGRVGITVNCVCPASAAHRAPADDGSDPDRRAAFDAMYDDHPLGRDGDPVTDIAPAVGFLLSDASGYVTGQTLMVDGGGMMRA